MHEMPCFAEPNAHSSANLTHKFWRGGIKLSRFHGSVQVDPLRLGRDAARIAEEIVQHLTGLVGSNVEITIEIQANLAEGAGDKLVRDVTENCRTLKFTDFGFEEE